MNRTSHPLNESRINPHTTKHLLLMIDNWLLMILRHCSGQVWGSACGGLKETQDPRHKTKEIFDFQFRHRRGKLQIADWKRISGYLEIRMWVSGQQGIREKRGRTELNVRNWTSNSEHWTSNAEQKERRERLLVTGCWLRIAYRVLRDTLGGGQGGV